MLRRIVSATAVALVILFGATAASNAVALPGVIASGPGVPSNSDRPVIEAQPNTLTFGIDGSLLIKNVQWTRVASTYANATGTIEANNCTPNCAEGQYVSQSVNLVFHIVTEWKKAPYFNCVRVDLPDGPAKEQFRASHLNLPLSPAAYASRIDCGPGRENS